jgi:hypothetical protein
MRVTRKVTAAERKGERRTIKVIKPHFQYRFLAHFIGFSILGILIANAIVFGYYFWRSGYDVSTQFLFQAHEGGPLHRISLLELLGPAMLASICIATGISTWIGLRFSHRIAGPLYRFEKTFKDIRRGHRIEAVTLRKHDEFKEVAGELTKMLKWLWKKGRNK